MKIIIPGGAGQIGNFLASTFHKDGNEVVVLSRNSQKKPWKCLQWDGQNLGSWVKEFESANTVINLAGQSVNCRYNSENRKIIKESRINSTKVIAEAIKQVKNPPDLWLQSSTATIYAHRYDAPNDEETGILGGSEPNLPDTWAFSIDVAKSWEKAFDETILPLTRKIKLRTAIVMDPNEGGAFSILLRLVRFGLGGTNGNGNQYVSWIHYQDFIKAIYWLIENKSIEGIVNIAAPNPLPNKEFMGILRKSWGISFGLPATDWMLEIGAIFLQTETELILKSRRVVPGLLLKKGFSFKFLAWEDASKDLCQQWKTINR